jgi:DNA-binding transcriptional ArsR family regulator
MTSLIQITYALKALTDITRLRMMRLLVSRRAEIGVSEFVDSLQGLPYNVSKQLKILEQAGLVRSSKQGRNVYYRLGTDDAAVVDRLLQLIASLPDTGGDFASDLRRYDRHVEGGMEPEEEIADEDSEPESPDEGVEETEELPSHLL